MWRRWWYAAVFTCGGMLVMFWTYYTATQSTESLALFDRREAMTIQTVQPGPPGPPSKVGAKGPAVSSEYREYHATTPSVQLHLVQLLRGAR